MTTATLQPLDDRIVCRPIPDPDQPVGVLWTPAQENRPTRAEVIAVGPGRRADSGARLPPPADVGDVVLLAAHGPTEVEVDGELLLCCTPIVVLAIDTTHAYGHCSTCEDDPDVRAMHAAKCAQ